MASSARSNAWRDRRDFVQAGFAVACLIAVIAFSFLADTGARDASRQAAAPRAQTDDEIYTGSILFMPYMGNDCRQNLLDNLTGQIRENGVVACDLALSHSSAGQARTWSAARVDAIRDGFSKR